MSLMPVIPNFTQNLQGYTPKSFWKRPEGPFGMVVLAALIIGTGVGLYVNAGQYVDARVTVAWALINGSTSRAGDGQAYFRLGFKF